MSNVRRTLLPSMVALALAALCIVAPHRASAQATAGGNAEEPHPDERPTRDAASSFLGWFRDLMNTMPSWVASVDREKLLDQLRSLNADLFWVRDRKSLFLAQMEAGVLDESKAAPVIDSINDRVRALRDGVQKVGGRLGAQQRAGGDSVARRLSDASGARKLWISELVQAQRRRDSTRVRALLNDGRRTVVALDSAGAALGGLIQKLGET